MSGASDPYVRVYYSIVTDERFATIYSDDKALALWLRLLLTADGTYPAPAPLPRHASAKALQVLIDAGVLEIPGPLAYAGFLFIECSLRLSFERVQKLAHHRLLCGRHGLHLLKKLSDDATAAQVLYANSLEV